MRNLRMTFALCAALMFALSAVYGDEEGALPVITPENAGDLTLLTTLGRGRMLYADHTPDVQTIAVATWTGLYFHQMDRPDAEPTLWRGETIYTSAVEYNPDGTQMAVARSDGIWIVDVQTDATLHHFTPDYIASRALRFNPDGTKLASLQCTTRAEFDSRCRDDELIIWNLQTGAVETYYMPRKSFPQLDSLWFDEAWTRVLIQDVNRISIYELPSGRPLMRFEADWQANPRGVGILSADGQQLIHAGSDATGVAVGIWNLSDIPPETRMLSEVAPVHKVTLTPSHPVSEYMGFDLRPEVYRVYGYAPTGEIYGWSLETGELVEELRSTLSPNIEWAALMRPWRITPRSVFSTYGTFTFNPAQRFYGDRVLETEGGGGDPLIRLWELADAHPSPVELVDVNGDTVNGVPRDLSPDGSKLLFYHDDLPEVQPSIKVYDFQTQQVSTLTTDREYFYDRPVWTGLNRITFPVRGPMNEKYIDHWNMQGSMSRVYLAREIPGASPSTSRHIFVDNTHLFSPDGHLYIGDTCYGDGGGYDCKRGKLMAWDTNTGAYLGTLDIHLSPGATAPKARSPFTFSADGRVFAALFCTNPDKEQGCTESEIQFWDVRQLEDAHSQVDENAVPVALQPYAARIIMDRRYSAIALSPEISPDQRLIAVSDVIENTIRLWSVNLVTGDVILLGKLSDTGAYAAFNGDGTLLVTGGDGTVKLWGVPN